MDLYDVGQCACVRAWVRFGVCSMCTRLFLYICERILYVRRCPRAGWLADYRMALRLPKLGERESRRKSCVIGESEREGGSPIGLARVCRPQFGQVPLDTDSDADEHDCDCICVLLALL